MSDILKRCMYLADRLLEANRVPGILRDQVREMLAGDELPNGKELLEKLKKEASHKTENTELMLDVADELERLI